jgi:hypothetical protein
MAALSSAELARLDQCEARIRDSLKSCCDVLDACEALAAIRGVAWKDVFAEMLREFPATSNTVILAELETRIRREKRASL